MSLLSVYREIDLPLLPVLTEAEVTGSISLGPGAHLPDKEVTVVKVAGTTLTLAAVVRPEKVPNP